MCNLSKGVEEKGIAKGRTEASLSLIRNLMDSTGPAVEKAMAMLKIPEEDRAKYAELLAKQ